MTTQLKLRDARLAAGLTQAELAEAANTTKMQIWRFECGHRPISPEWARLLAPPLNVDDPNRLISNPADSAEWGRGRPAGRKVTGLVKREDRALRRPDPNYVEDMLLLHWRALAPAEKEAMLDNIVERARAFVRDDSPRPNVPGQRAVNV